MSVLTRSRVAGSARRFKRDSRPPSRDHGGRHASRPLEARFQGYWLAATSMPEARASSIFLRISGIRPKLDLYAVFRCQTCVRIFASRAIVKTSSSESSIRFDSERWWVKYAPPYRAATFARAVNSSVEE